MAQDVRNPLSSLHDWWRLDRVTGLGPAFIRAFEQRQNEPWQQLFRYSREQLLSLGISSSQIAQIQKDGRREFDRFLEWRDAQRDRFVLCPQDTDYPTRLKQTAQPPFILYGRGNASVLSKPQLAIVGSRHPSPSGQHNASRFAAELATCGWVVTSGLALGVDGHCHRGALSVGGETVAVLGTGVDVLYPKRHSKLAAEILARGGTLLSELPPQSPPRAQNFPRRNRIISGMSYGVLIVEAAIKSGSLITARYALDQDREVFAVPGNIQNPLTEGCHFLIKQGAKLTERVSDINEEFQNLSFLHGKTDEKNLQKSPKQSLATDKLLDSVEFEVTAMDVVIQRSGMPIKDVTAQLLEYELRGLVAAVPGGYVKLGGK